VNVHTWLVVSYIDIEIDTDGKLQTWRYKCQTLWISIVATYIFEWVTCACYSILHRE